MSDTVRSNYPPSLQHAISSAKDVQDTVCQRGNQHVTLCREGDGGDLSRLAVARYEGRKPSDFPQLQSDLSGQFGEESAVMRDVHAQHLIVICNRRMLGATLKPEAPNNNMAFGIARQQDQRKVSINRVSARSSSEAHADSATFTKAPENGKPAKYNDGVDCGLCTLVRSLSVRSF
jgi:hypothetical protein